MNRINKRFHAVISSRLLGPDLNFQVCCCPVAVSRFKVTRIVLSCVSNIFCRGRCPTCAIGMFDICQGVPTQPMVSEHRFTHLNQLYIMNSMNHKNHSWESAIELKSMTAEKSSGLVQVQVVVPWVAVFTWSIKFNVLFDNVAANRQTPGASQSTI